MKRLLTASFIAAMLASGAALAQVGPYVGASMGLSDYKVDCEGLPCDTTDFGFKAFGGYMFTPNLGVEAHYVNLGKLTLDPTVVPGFGTVAGDLKGTGWGASLVGAFPIDQFSVFGKIGFTYMDTKVSGSIAGFGSASESDSSTNLSWGLGAAYNFDKQLSVRVEWERFRLEFDNEKEDADFFSVGVVYRF